MNLHLSTDQSKEREIISLNNDSPPSTVLNPTYGDLRQYIENVCKLTSNSVLVFVDLAQPDSFLCDLDSLKDTAAAKGVDLCAVELMSPIGNGSQQQQQPTSAEHQQPMINLVAVNVYPRSINNSNVKSFTAFGLPFAVLINRDCTYPELCRKLLESQSKYFTDRNVLKYKVIYRFFIFVYIRDSG